MYLHNEASWSLGKSFLGWLWAQFVSKIILINRYFHSDLSVTSQMASDMAFTMARYGCANASCRTGSHPGGSR